MPSNLSWVIVVLFGVLRMKLSAGIRNLLITYEIKAQASWTVARMILRLTFGIAFLKLEMEL